MEGGEERQEEVVVAVGRRRHSRSTPPSMCGEGRAERDVKGPAERAGPRASAAFEGVGEKKKDFFVFVLC